MGPIISQLSNAVAQAATQFANSGGGKYILHKVATTIAKKL